MALAKEVYESFVTLLKNELVVALGCTEPIAIAYAGAKLREVLGDMPDRIEVHCSGNIVKNVKAVTVPNSGGQRGIEVAATLGVVGGDAKRMMAVLEAVAIDDIAKTKELIANGFCECFLVKDVSNLYIVLKGYKGASNASVTIKDYHVNVVKIEKDNKVLFEQEYVKASNNSNSLNEKQYLSVANVLKFANTVAIEDIKEILDNQIKNNVAISNEGLKGGYGAEVGLTLLNEYDNTKVATRAKARAAAGSDARMSGCPLPVVINSGSGNQGITASLPVIEYAETLKVSNEKLYRALVISNLIAIHQKRFIGSLSAYCGAVSAACGAGAGIAYLLGMSYDEICNVITASITNIGGMICDGAKSSCAAKIALAVESAILAINLTKRSRGFKAGEGLVQDNIEKTIAGLGYVGRVGMKSTDEEILNIMLDRVSLNTKVCE